MVAPFDGVGVPPRIVYAPVSVSPFPCPLSSQFAVGPRRTWVTYSAGQFSPGNQAFLLPSGLLALKLTSVSK